MLEKLTNEQKETLKKLCYDYKVFQTMESESKKGKEKTAKDIKALLESIGFNDTETIDVFSIQYREVTKSVIDSEEMKKDGIYNKYTKQQKTKPLTIR